MLLVIPKQYLHFRGHQEPIFAMTCRGGKLYSTGRDMLIKVWDTEDVTQGCIATLKGHTDVVRVISCCIIIWDEIIDIIQMNLLQFYYLMCRLHNVRLKSSHFTLCVFFRFTQSAQHGQLYTQQEQTSLFVPGT